MKRVLLFGFVLAAPACGGDATGEKDIGKALAFNETKKEEKKEEAPAAPAEKKLELPWAFEAVRESLRGGATLVYKQSGTNAKGKPVEDDWRCEVKKSSGEEVGVVCDGVNHPSKDKGATQVAMQKWSSYSPFFVVDQAEHQLEAFEDVTVPAGQFSTVRADLKDFFGNHYTVWMIEDKPGIYAKVVKHPNTSDENDKTEMTFELAELTTGQVAQGGG